MNISKYIKQARELKKLSQMQVAKATRITQGAISLWENGERIPNIIDMIKLADYYNISLDELVGRDFF